MDAQQSAPVEEQIGRNCAGHIRPKADAHCPRLPNGSAEAELWSNRFILCLVEICQLDPRHLAHNEWGASCPPGPIFSHLAISYLSGAQFEASPSDVAMCADIASRGIDALTMTRTNSGKTGANRSR